MRIEFRPLGALSIALLALAWTPVFPQSSTPAVTIGRPMQVMPLAATTAPASTAPAAQPHAAPSVDLDSVKDSAALTATTRAALDDALARPITQLGDREVDALWFTSLRQTGRSSALIDALEKESAE